MQAQEAELMTEWSRLLVDALANRPAACRWLLDELASYPSALEELLLSPHDVIQDAAALLVFAALHKSMITGGTGQTDDGGGGRGGLDDSYKAAYKAMVKGEGDDEQEEEDEAGGEGRGLDSSVAADGFVAVGRDSGGTGAAVEKKDGSQRRSKTRTVRKGER